MGAGLKASVSGRRLADIVAVTAEDWKAAGNGLRLRIITRTRGHGVDANGRSFEPYSEGYKRAKAKRAGMVGRVNLTGVKAGGRMLDDITVKANASANPRITLSFATAAKDQIAQYHMGEGRVDREFFALSEADLDYVIDFIRNRLNKRQG